MAILSQDTEWEDNAGEMAGAVHYMGNWYTWEHTAFAEQSRGFESLILPEF